MSRDTKERISVGLSVETGRAQKTRGPMRTPPRRLLPSQPDGCRWPPVRMVYQSWPEVIEEDDARPDV
jgi:hypothetical protein